MVLFSTDRSIATLFASRRRGNGGKRLVVALVVALTAMTLVLSGCNYDTRASGRSGTYQDDYMESPIDEEFTAYRPALDASNDIITLMQAGDAKTIADNYVLDELKPLLTEADIQKVIDSSTEKFGSIVEYKPMQWGFEPRVENGKRDKSEFNKVLAEKYGDGKKAASKIPIVFSVKVVQHENATVNYWLQFPDDGEYNKILGIYYKEHLAPRNVGSF